ncbi:hypothetical protein [Asticcacaulis machinosus]|uniref:Uncharacterized protein n=1 Tax=Asticcacaulis machinosus TaxID=2984211 RepID=A0ABT5HJX3_9CAUL|nr:hypothetical protein [Asticcacaulis machinosus]MDC7676544.1 hypothetical protein [Asticcacaulis machinosus]
MPDNPKPVDPVVSPKTRHDSRDPSGFNEPDYPDNAADQIIPDDLDHKPGDEVSGFDDRKPSDVHKY